LGVKYSKNLLDLSGKRGSNTLIKSQFTEIIKEYILKNILIKRAIFDRKSITIKHQDGDY